MALAFEKREKAVKVASTALALCVILALCAFLIINCNTGRSTIAKRAELAAAILQARRASGSWPKTTTDIGAGLPHESGLEIQLIRSKPAEAQYMVTVGGKSRPLVVALDRPPKRE